ncbi:MAG: type II/IV secretion system ATPase subunit [Bacilli bacterium]|nr:type II/IV secretion system ATPase subunit [Bacilli bacterium]
MNHKQVREFIESSFLEPIIHESSVTDISYNGDSIYLVDNKFGRKKSGIKISLEKARDFIRQIANMCEKQFSYQNPILDVSVEKYRINAVHQSISKRNNDDVITFSIRIASEQPRIYKGCNFFEKGIEELLSILIKSRVSIVIGGVTGSGKTEFQKYLISCMSEHTRVIVIDNILELDSLPNELPLDLNVWQSDERSNNSSIQQLVKNALRSNPDWLIVAESRGEEMIDVLNSSLTGHPVITTIHSYDLSAMPIRMARMALMSNAKLDFEVTLTDLEYHMKFYIYLKKTVLKDGSINRCISDIGFLNNGKMETIFKYDNGVPKYVKLSNSAQSYLDLSCVTKEFKKLFLGDKT